MLSCRTRARPAEETRLGGENAKGNGRRTFDVVQDRDYVLSKELRGAAAELGSLNQLENGSNFRVFVGEKIAGQGGTEREGDTCGHQSCGGLKDPRQGFESLQTKAG